MDVLLSQAPCKTSAAGKHITLFDHVVSSPRLRPASWFSGLLRDMVSHLLYFCLLCFSGANLVAVLFADMGAKAGQYSSDVAVLGLVVGVLLGGGYLFTQHTQQQQPGSSSSSSGGGSGLQPPEVPPLEAPREEALQGHQK